MLTDVGSTPHYGDSNPFGFVEVGELTYFSTKPSSFDPQQTWVTDGTTNATRLLSEVLPGNLLIGGVVGNVAGRLYFTASDSGPVGYRLWQWDGFGSEPAPVLSAAGNRISISTPMVEVGGAWYFGGQSTGEGPELWRTDGTQTGTYLVKEIRPSALGGLQPPSNAAHQATLFNVDGTLMFIANDGTHGSELWTSDGTETGTFMVKDVFEGSSSGVYGSSSSGRIAAVMGDLLFFSATDQTFSAELWRSDGTEAGTYQVKDIRPGNQGSTPQHLTNVGEVLYFAANDGTNGNELWKSDGTEAGTVLVKNIESSGLTTGPFDLTEMNGVLYFGADGTLWRSDGTEAGTTQLLGDQPFIQLPGLSASFNEKYANLDQIVNLNGTLYFPGRDSYGSQVIALWKYDGVGNATRVLSKNTAGLNFFNTFETIHFLTAAGDKLYFAGGSSNHGNEPWISDGTTAGTQLLKDVTGMSTASNVGALTNVDGTLHFIANTGVSSTTPPRGWWTTDGTIAGTTSYAAVAGKLNAYSMLGSSGGLTFFKTTNSLSDNDWELWRTDGTAAGTFRVKDIRPGAESGLGSGRTDAVEMNGFLYFRANDGATGFELWRSDGTEAGTTMVVDLNAGPINGIASTYGKLVNVDGTLYFVGNDGASGNALWKTDGTAAGTSLVRSFSSWTPTNLYNGNGTLYFGAGDAELGLELWKSDGTAAGTEMVKDIAPGNSLWHVDPPGFANIGDTIYFIANDGVTGPELWKSDGTAEGTILVKDIRTDGLALLSRLIVVGNTLYFYANDGVHGAELWKSDGTEAGTALVKDIRPGSSASNSGAFANPVNVGGILYFSASDGVNGAELWRSDGTAAGTYLVRNINAIYSGSGGSDLGSLTNVNGRLYFTANDGTHGAELWVLSPDPVAIGTGDYDQNGVTDGADFLKWQRAFGSADVTNDGDGDGTIGGGDLSVWKVNFEPSATTLQQNAVTAAIAELAAEEEIADENESLAAESESGPERGERARDALFAAGDFSRLFGVGGDGEFETSLWRRGRASLARRG